MPKDIDDMPDWGWALVGIGSLGAMACCAYVIARNRIQPYPTSSFFSRRGSIVTPAIDLEMAERKDGKNTDHEANPYLQDPPSGRARTSTGTDRLMEVDHPDPIEGVRTVTRTSI